MFELTALNLYFIMKMDALRNLLSCLGILSGVGLFATVVFKSELKLKTFILPIMFFVLVGTFTVSHFATPSTKEICAIYAVPAIMNNENVQKIPDMVLELGIEWLEELRPNKESK